MHKGARTRERIVERAAAVFNCQGYAGASMSAIMAATGLNKGGLYNHFGSKEALALASFDYATRLLGERLTAAVESEAHAADKLVAFCGVFLRNVVDAPLAGGCPILNTAVESDDAHPVLRERAREAMSSLRARIRTIVEAGIASGEIEPSASADELASLFIATLEGGIMLSNLYKDAVHIRRAVRHLSEHVESRLRVGGAR